MPKTKTSNLIPPLKNADLVLAFFVLYILIKIAMMKTSKLVW